MPVAKLSVSLSSANMAEIERRNDYDNVSGVINRMLDRYLALLARARGELRNQLSADECALILDASNGSLHADAVSLGMLWAEIEDACALDGLHQKWGVDGAALVAKIAGAGLIGQVALIDGSERWWRRVSQGEQPPYADLLDDYRPQRYPLTQPL